MAKILMFQTVPSSGSAVPLVLVSSDARSVTAPLLVLMVTFTLTAGTRYRVISQVFHLIIFRYQYPEGPVCDWPDNVNCSNDTPCDINLVECCSEYDCPVS